MPVIGWLSGYDGNTDDLVLPAFRQALAARGYVEGRYLKLVLECKEDMRHRGVFARLMDAVALTFAEPAGITGFWLRIDYLRMGRPGSPSATSPKIEHRTAGRSCPQDAR